jgi:hypothetical protein
VTLTLTLTIGERAIILASLEDPPDGLSELRAVLLNEHEWRKREGSIRDRLRRQPLLASSAVTAGCEHENERHDEHHSRRAATEVDQSQPLHELALEASALDRQGSGLRGSEANEPRALASLAPSVA